MRDLFPQPSVHLDFTVRPNHAKITLINASNHVSLDGVSEAWKTASGQQLTVQMHVLRGGVQEGQRVIDISNGEIALSVLPGRGMGIHKAVANDVRLGWDSPVHGPVHPAYVPLSEPSGIGWLDGFDELVARCGLQSNGAPEFDANGKLLFGVHGRIANKPAQHVWVEFDEKADVLRLCGEVYETRFLVFNLRLTATVELPFDGTAFRIQDKVTNLSANPAEMQLLYHINFGLTTFRERQQVCGSRHDYRPQNVTSIGSQRDLADISTAHSRF